MWQAGQRMGATHMHILDTMGPQTAPGVERWRTTLLEHMRRGRTIESVVKQNPALVQPFEGALLSFGEESGSLEQSLITLAAHFKAEHRLLLRIWSKLTYPLIVSLAFVVIAPLPLIAQGQLRAYCIAVTVGLAAWYGLGGAVVVAVAAQFARRPEFVLARLARVLAGGIEAGLPLDRVVALAASATAHPALTAHLRRFSLKQLGAQPLSESFSGCAVIPHEMTAAMKVAELSGDYSGALRKLADLYES